MQDTFCKSRIDLQACAGLPTATKQINDTTQIFVYTGTQPQPSYGGSTLIPIGDIATTIAQLGGGGGTSCSAVIRLDRSGHNCPALRRGLAKALG